MGKPTLMEMLRDAGYPTEKMYHHESDLYVFATDLTNRVIDDWLAMNHFTREPFVKTFRDQQTGRVMFDIAFQYDPFWGKLERS